MTSEEERVEVAESIRHYAKESDEAAYEFIRGYWPNELADLIDPTCHFVRDAGDHVPHCDMCWTAIYGLPTRYCPNCGARVVSSDDVS